MRFISIFAFLASLSFGQWASAQTNDAMLAGQYYDKGEYDKAVVLYEKLHEKSPETNLYYRYYLNCLFELEDFRKAEKVVKRLANSNPSVPSYLVDLGLIYRRKGDEKKALKEFDESLELLQPDRNMVLRLANAYIRIEEYGYAEKVYQKGIRMMPYGGFQFDLAGLYGIQGFQNKMIDSYLDFAGTEPVSQDKVQYALQEYVQDVPAFERVERALIQRIQQSPNDIVFAEMLIWLYVQAKDFKSALVQARALDRRLREGGSRVFELANTALHEEQFDAASDAYQYLIDLGNKRGENPYYLAAKTGALRARNLKLTKGFQYTPDDLVQLERDYRSFISEYGHSVVQAAEARRDLARLQAYYLHKIDTAIMTMNELVMVRNPDPEFVPKCKLDLGDFFLISGDPWEATLLYSQVDKRMKDAPLGELARYKNAKLSYYQGDFEWAQAQLNILKASTSELISNDAMDLSVFITDHYGLDTTPVPMRAYARAQLLAFQNRLAEADLLMDSILNVFPGHDLGDDILLAKAEHQLKQFQYDSAVPFLQRILDEYTDGILVDNALFMLADLYQHHLGDSVKAAELYKKIILEHKGSVFAVDARNRFRKLRGDSVN